MNEEMKKLLASDLAQALGMAIKLRRIEMRMTLRDVSDATGITPIALSKIERGVSDMKISTLALLRSALGFEVAIKKINPEVDEPPIEPEPDED